MSQAAMSHGVVRLKPDSLAVNGLRFTCMACVPHSMAQINLSSRAVGPKRHRCAQEADGLFGSIAIMAQGGRGQQGPSEFLIDPKIAWVSQLCLLENLGCVA